MDKNEILWYSHNTMRLAANKAVEWIDKGDIARARDYLVSGLRLTSQALEESDTREQSNEYRMFKDYYN